MYNIILVKDEDFVKVNHHSLFWDEIPFHYCHFSKALK